MRSGIRASVLALGPLALTMLVVVALRVDKAEHTGAAALAFAAPLAVGALLCRRVLSALRSDFDGLAHFVRAERADAPTPRLSEMQPLFEAGILLRKRLGELEALRVEARRAIEAAERLRASFVAAMGHDLKGPLNSIVGFADLLVVDASHPIADSQRQSVEIIRRAAQDLLVLLDQILDWARLEAGRIVLDKQRWPAGDLIGEAIAEAQKRSADRGLVVDAMIPDELPVIMVDRVRFIEALLGLLDHATRTPNGPRVRIAAGLAAAAQSLEIEVHDAALLVREADRRNFFEAFRPSYAPSGQRIAGLGLGPALARALIRAHGGDVWFESVATSGTTFRLSLPPAP